MHGHLNVKLCMILHTFITNVCLAMFVHQSVAYNNFRIIGQICMKFGTGGFIMLF